MIVMTVVDDRMGMMFHYRRQSQDRVLRKKMLSIAAGTKLWMNAYSYGQFQQEVDKSILCVDNFLELAREGEYCFVEDEPLQVHLPRIETLILFRWNRSYPGDQFLDIDLSKKEWKLTKVEEFSGSSHEKITMEVYAHEK